MAVPDDIGYCSVGASRERKLTSTVCTRLHIPGNISNGTKPTITRRECPDIISITCL